MVEEKAKEAESEAALVNATASNLEVPGDKPALVFDIKKKPPKKKTVNEQFLEQLAALDDDYYTRQNDELAERPFDKTNVDLETGIVHLDFKHIKKKKGKPFIAKSWHRKYHLTFH